MQHLGDVTLIDGGRIPPVDVITGGSPCQDLSIAGKRAGLAGERSGLYMEQIRIIKELRYADILRGRTGQLIRPRFMVWENVPGAFSSGGGQDFRAVLEEAARVSDPGAAIPGPPAGRWNTSGAVLGDGWSIAWRVLDAQFWGVPQRRRRIALVADFGGHAAPEILFVRESVCGDSRQGEEAREALAAGAGGGAGSAGGKCIDRSALMNGNEGGDYQTLFCMATQQGGAEIRSDNCAPTLTAAAGMSGNNQPVICAAFMGGQGAKARSLGYTVEAAPTLKASPSGGNTVPCVYENHGQDSRLTGPLDVAPTVAQKFGTGGNNTPLVMATGQSGAEILENRAPALNCNHEQPIVTGLDCRNGTENMELSATLQAKANGGQSLNCTHPVRIGQTVRRLTPLECERLQGFPDGWTDIGPWTDSKGKLHKESCDSARYKALGNSIALPPWRWVLLRIAACYERPATLGSLFDGIGGFPLIWERLNGAGTALWASEIEEFPTAVTRYHFGETPQPPANQ